MKKFICTAAAVLSAAIFVSCVSSDAKGGAADGGSGALLSESTAEKSVQKKMNKGKGIVIAVLQPELSGAAQGDSWIPQYFQDSLTGKIASFSKMTVLDRKNEALAVAEQERSESGFYSEENAVQIGRMTNANLVAAGSVRKIADSYELNFRVNDIETNEIKTSFNSRCSLSQMQDGTAVNETARALLEGLGVELSKNEQAALGETNSFQNSSALNLAKGNAAEKSGNLIDALLAYDKVGDRFIEEAKNSIGTILNGSISGSRITQKIRRYESERAKWIKLFNDWYEYMESGNWFFCVYDFSTVQDSVFFSQGRNKVTLNITPGVKIVPKQEAIILHRQIFDSWKAVASRPENDEWARMVFFKLPAKMQGDSSYSVSVRVDLMNENGIAIKDFSHSFTFTFMPFNHNKQWEFRGLQGSERAIRYPTQVLSQRDYYNAVNFYRVSFLYVDAQDITDSIVPTVSEVSIFYAATPTKYAEELVSAPIVSVSEAEAFLE